MKKCIMVGYEEEKLLALRMYAEQKGVSIEEELAQAAEKERTGKKVSQKEFVVGLIEQALDAWDTANPTEE